jgi:hypothetical protein
MWATLQCLRAPQLRRNDADFPPKYGQNCFGRGREDLDQQRGKLLRQIGTLKLISNYRELLTDSH